jgi:hypothetical protein
MAEIKDPRGKHLLGEAVRLLVQSGVTGAAISDFISEYSSVIEATFSAPPEPATPDIRAQMKEALKEALLELAPAARKNAEGRRKQVSVYIAGAKKTTVFVRRDLLENAAVLVGSEKQARQLVNELANSKPEDQVNRSAWVEEQLQHHLLLLKAESHFPGKSAH